MANTYKARTAKHAPIGSGHTYIFDYDGQMPSAAEIVAQCTPENRYGTTKNGATLSYTVTKHEETDDFGTVRAKISQKEDVKLKLGVFSWAPNMLAKLASTFRTEEEDDYIVHRIGGLENDDGKQYLVVFEHVDKVHGNLYICIVGTNETGLTLAYSMENSTKLEPEFAADPQDDAGTKVMIIECKPTPPPIQQADAGDGV